MWQLLAQPLARRRRQRRQRQPAAGRLVSSLRRIATRARDDREAVARPGRTRHRQCLGELEQLMDVARQIAPASSIRLRNTRWSPASAAL